MIMLSKVKIKGSVKTILELDKLITNVSEGDSYITSEDGYLYVYTKSSWVNAGVVVKGHKFDNKIYK